MQCLIVCVAVKMIIIFQFVIALTLPPTRALQGEVRPYTDPNKHI